ncbi:MAG: hypothetical protein V4488_00780 [Pseudomonadota bacterium]
MAGPQRSTDQYTVGRFRSHGSSTMRFEDGILYYVTRGPFNLQLVQASELALRDLLAEVQPQLPWGEIVVVEGSALLATEVLDALQRLIAALARDGLAAVATAMVAAPEVEGISITRKLVARIYAADGRPFQYFEHEQDAQAWIAGMLQGVQEKP